MCNILTFSVLVAEIKDSGVLTAIRAEAETAQSLVQYATCSVACAPATAPKNGVVHQTGVTAGYSCDSGYQQSGEYNHRSSCLVRPPPRAPATQGSSRAPCCLRPEPGSPGCLEGAVFRRFAGHWRQRQMGTGASALHVCPWAHDFVINEI